MKSFWGVQHGVVSKTYVASGVYRSAHTIPKSMLRTTSRLRPGWVAQDKAAAQAFNASAKAGAKGGKKGYRSWVISQDPVKRMRASARSDSAATTKSHNYRIAHDDVLRGRAEWHALSSGDRLHAAEYSPQGVSGYRDVERRMAGLKRR